MELIKRTKEEIRAAFKEYMREKKEEREQAKVRLEMLNQKKVAGLA
jgi:hypothetical protein